MKLTMTVNGVENLRRSLLARLLDVLRGIFNLPGTKEGCGEGERGACSVFVDGQFVNSCLVPAMQAAGRDVQTIEGVAPSAELIDRVQQAFVQHGGAQCGIGTPGMILAAKALLKEHPQPTVAVIREGLAGGSPVPLHRIHQDFRIGAGSDQAGREQP